MTIDPKILKRIRILSRLADEKRNSSVHERESAAMEFVKLIRENNIPIGDEVLDEDEQRNRERQQRKQRKAAQERETNRPAKRETRVRPAPVQQPWYPPPPPQPREEPVNGTPVIMRFAARCHFCGQVLHAGETAFQLLDFGQLFIHDWPCRVEY